jgi:hypothetical protein
MDLTVGSSIFKLAHQIQASPIKFEAVSSFSGCSFNFSFLPLIFIINPSKFDDNPMNFQADSSKTNDKPAKIQNNPHKT